LADPRLNVVEPSGTAGAFYFDLGDPESWLAAERVLQVLPFAAEWVPVLGLGTAFDGARCAEELAARREDVERRAAAQGLLPVRWPATFPFDTEPAQLAATYAKSIGRAVPFALAAFRQCFAGGRALDDDTLLLAGAACEMAPRATLTGAGTRGTRRALEEATALARERGVTSVPAVWSPDRAVVEGDTALRQAYGPRP
jgi:2-hydroxychromene-2-carboxylate isomerase